MRLAHLHIPRLIPYTHASHIQELLIQRQFRHKELLRTPATPLPPPPDPTILTFSCPPTYTVGRRYLPSLAATPHSNADDDVDSDIGQKPNPKHNDYQITGPQISYLTGSPQPLASFHPASRGGLLTYHAPGQLTAYPILNLRAHSLTPRNYVRHLESSVISTCAALSVPKATTTSDPGVWITADAQPPRKICAVGVQIRRGITGHGVGLNVVDEPAPAEYVHDNRTPAAGYLSWGFGRIVACGLEGKGVTWMAREGMDGRVGVDAVGGVFAQMFARTLPGVEEVYSIDEPGLDDGEGPKSFSE